MSSSNKKLYDILQRIRANYPSVTIVEAEKTHWDPKTATIYYDPDGKHILWSIFHELGHAENKHSTYKLDIQLVKMESEAWATATTIAKSYQTKIDEDYIQDCIDSYRDWLHKRSRCPKCTQTGVQTNELHYTCLNCRQSWKVTKSKFCRAYRRKILN